MGDTKRVANDKLIAAGIAELSGRQQQCLVRSRRYRIAVLEPLETQRRGADGFRLQLEGASREKRSTNRWADDERPAVVQSFLKAHARATAFINANTDEAVRIGVQYTGMDEKTVRMALGNITYLSELERGPVREYASYLARLGYIKETDPEVILRDYIDPAGLVKDDRP